MNEAETRPNRTLEGRLPNFPKLAQFMRKTRDNQIAPGDGSANFIAEYRRLANYENFFLDSAIYSVGVAMGARFEDGFIPIAAVTGDLFSYLYSDSKPCDSGITNYVFMPEVVYDAYTLFGCDCLYLSNAEINADIDLALRLIRESVDCGIPVLAWGVGGVVMRDGARYDPLPEGALIGGYDTAAHILLANLYPEAERLAEASAMSRVGVDAHGYTAIEEQAALATTKGLFFVRDILDAPEADSVRLRALRSIPRWLALPERDGYSYGKTAFERWAGVLLDDANWESAEICNANLWDKHLCAYCAICTSIGVGEGDGGSLSFVKKVIAANPDFRGGEALIAHYARLRTLVQGIWEAQGGFVPPAEKMTTHAFRVGLAATLREMGGTCDEIARVFKANRPSEVTLAPADAQDAECLARMQKAAFRRLYGLYRDEGNPYLRSAEEIIDWMSRPNWRVWKILADGVVCGGIAACARRDAEDECYLARAYVVPEMQGLGIVSKACLLCEQAFPNAKRWTLDFPIEQIANRRCYEKAGYTATGETCAQSEGKIVLAIYEKRRARKFTNEEILDVAMRQSAIDANCAPEDFQRAENVVVTSKPNPNARRYLDLPFFVNLMTYGGNIVASTDARIAGFVTRYLDAPAPYRCFETPRILRLAEEFAKYGFEPFFMAEYWLPDLNALRLHPCAYELRLLRPDDFAALYRPQWHNALCEARKELDRLAVGAYDGAKLVGLAGCSADCDSMWQIGVDVLPEYRRRGIACALTSRLALEVLERGYVPFYSCAWSNLASARNAIKSGFRPAWIEHTSIEIAKAAGIPAPDAEDGGFWSALDRLIANSGLTIDRPKGSKHPRFDFIYPLDYGYLNDTASMDGGGIDVWRGTRTEKRCDAVICIVDLMKRDSEIKLLIGCTEEEKAEILRFHNESAQMKGVIIRRPTSDR